ncbi:MAG: HAD-IIB family hydrolase [Acidiferrobacter sp.]
MTPTILATDLDGTFLGGSPEQQLALYDWIRERRDEILLFFVSGRGLGFMRKLTDTLSLTPDYVIGNIGTSVASGEDWRPVASVDSWISERWPADAEEAIRSTLDDHSHLRPQPISEGRRLSFFYTDHQLAVKAKNAIEGIGFDVVLSDSQYFDVLPPGVQKGPTLLRLLNALGLPYERTLVAGDTMNDLSMFQTGLAGVCVANSEPALKAALEGLPHVQQSPLPGAAGVLEALESFHRENR